MRRRADQIVVVSRFKFTRDETGNQAHQPMTADLYCVMGNPVGAAPLAVDPRPLCRTHRPGALPTSAA